MNNSTLSGIKPRLFVFVIILVLGFAYRTKAQIIPDRGSPVTRTMRDFRIDTNVIANLPSISGTDREIFGFVNHASSTKDPKEARAYLEKALNAAHNNPIPPRELNRALSNRSNYSGPSDMLSGLRTDTTPPNRDEQILARNFTEKFVIPYELSQLDITEGKYPDGLKKLFMIYYDKSFTEKNTKLEEKLKKDFGGNTLPETIFQIKSDSINLYGTQLDSGEITFIKVQVAQMYLDWGNDLFKKGIGKEMRERAYLQVLNIGINGFDPLKPFDFQNIIIDPKLDATLREAMINIMKSLSGYANQYKGYPIGYFPIWSYSFLRKTTIEYINTAKGLERDIMSYIETNRQDADRIFIAQQNITTSSLIVRISREKQNLDSMGMDIALKNKELAELKLKDKNDEIERFESLYHLAVANATAIETANYTQKILKSSGNQYKEAKDIVVITNESIGHNMAVAPEVGKYVNSVFGFSTTGTDQLNMNTEHYFQLKTERDELQKMVEAADIEIGKANQMKVISKLEAGKTELDLNNAILLLDHYQKGTIDRGFNVKDLIDTSKMLMNNYIKYAKYLAELTQRAYELEELDKVDAIDSSYLVDGKQVSLTSDRLLYDLNTIEYKRITNKKQKESPSTYIISLRNKNLLNMEHLRQTGRITFTIDQAELDVAFPGTYRQLIDDIDVAVIALTDPTGVRGKLTREGLSWIKVPKSFNENISTQDWIKYNPTNYALLMLKNYPETMLLPKQPQGKPNADNEGLKTLFEGNGVCGAYTLELPKYSNNFDFNTITDVIIKINFSSYYDDDLKNTIEQELCDLESRHELPFERLQSFSLSNDFPDENYYFHNPVDSSEYFDKYRVIPIYVKKDDFPINQYDKNLSTVMLNFSGLQGAIPVKCKLTSKALNPTINYKFQDGQFVFGNANTTIDNLRWFPNETLNEKFEYTYDPQKKSTIYVHNTDKLDELGAELFDLWLVRIDAEDNPELCQSSTLKIFDQEKLNKILDINLGLGYTFNMNYCAYWSPPPLYTKVDTVISKSLFYVSNGAEVKQIFQVPYYYYLKNRNEFQDNIFWTNSVKHSSVWFADSIHQYFKMNLIGNDGNISIPADFNRYFFVFAQDYNIAPSQELTIYLPYQDTTTYNPSSNPIFKKRLYASPVIKIKISENKQVFSIAPEYMPDEANTLLYSEPIVREFNKPITTIELFISGERDMKKIKIYINGEDMLNGKDILNRDLWENTDYKKNLHKIDTPINILFQNSGVIIHKIIGQND